MTLLTLSGWSTSQNHHCQGRGTSLIEIFSRLAVPLEILSDLTKKLAPYISERTPACEKAFSDLKRSLCDEQCQGRIKTHRGPKHLKDFVPIYICNSKLNNYKPQNKMLLFEIATKLMARLENTVYFYLKNFLRFFLIAKSLIRTSRLILHNTSASILSSDKASSLPCCIVVLIGFLIYFS